MKVFYSANDHQRLISGDETVKLYASEEHPAIKGKPTRSTAYIGDTKRIIEREEPEPVDEPEPTPEEAEATAEVPSAEPESAAEPEEAPKPKTKAPAKKTTKKSK